MPRIVAADSTSAGWWTAWPAARRPELGEGLSWAFGIVDGAVEDVLRFQVVPEPGAAALLLAGLVFLARGRRPIA